MAFERAAKKSKGGRFSAPRNTAQAAPAPEEPKPVKKPKRQKREKPQRQKRRWGPREICLALVPAVAAILAAFLVMLLVDMGASYEFKEDGTQYYAGNSAPVMRGSQMKYQSDGTLLMTQNGITAPVSLPVYLNNSRELVIAQDLIYYTPRTMTNARAVHFNHILCRENGAIFVSNDRKQTQMDAGFLFDGGNLFIFLEPTVVEFNGYSIEVPALSYAEAVFGSHINVFNYETKESFIEKPTGEASARPVEGGYTISLLADSMDLDNGTKWLLLSRADVSDPIL